MTLIFWYSVIGQLYKAKQGIPKIIALDTGCCWGKELTFLRLEDQKKFVIKSKQK
jgi:hypothetical protein